MEVNRRALINCNSDSGGKKSCKKINIRIIPQVFVAVHFQLLTEKALLKVSRFKMRTGGKKGK
jgi:hypothetical protein